MRYLLVFVILLAGCGGVSKPSTQPLTISWQTNGNVGVPICSTSITTNCVDQVQVLDQTTDKVYVAQANEFTIIVGSPSDTYEIRTTGKDKDGNELNSIYERVP